MDDIVHIDSFIKATSTDLLNSFSPDDDPEMQFKSLSIVIQSGAADLAVLDRALQVAKRIANPNERREAIEDVLRGAERLKWEASDRERNSAA